MPIYMVIAKTNYNFNKFTYSIFTIIKILKINDYEIQEAWDKHVVPLIEMGNGITVFYLEREPDSDFREIAEEM